MDIEGSNIDPMLKAVEFTIIIIIIIIAIIIIIRTHDRAGLEKVKKT